MSHDHMFGDTSFRTVTGLSYQDPVKISISLIKVIKTIFQRNLCRTPRQCRIKIVLVGLNWKRVSLTPPFHDPHV
jgi:hypothetical protein